MLPGPVFHVELRTLARKGRYYALRAVYGGLLLFFLWANLPHYASATRFAAGELSIREASRLGESLFSTFAVVQSLAILLLTPATIAGTIADERQRKTLHYLLASRLSGAEIVLGKVFARGLHLVVFLAAGLPILVMISLLGGVDPNLILLFFAASLSAGYLIAGFSILASTRARRPREAVSMSYAALALWLFGPAAFLAIGPELGPSFAPAFDAVRPAVALVGESSPFSFLLGSFRLPASALLDAIARMIGLQLALGTLFLAVAVLRLRPWFRKEGGRVALSARLGRLGGFRLLRRPDCGDDAMLWKELRVARSGPSARLANRLMLLIVLGTLAYGGSYFVPDAFRELTAEGYSAAGSYRSRGELNGFLRVAMTLLGCCILLGTASAASASMTSEREEDTWISLLATPLTAAEIVRAKLVGAAWSLRAVIAIWGALLALGLLLGAVHPLGAFAATFALAVYTAFGAGLGLHHSLGARTSARALVATVATLLATHFGPPLVLSMVGASGSNMFAWMGMTPFVLAVTPMSYADVNTFSGAYGYSSRFLGEAAATSLLSLMVHGLAAVSLAALSVTRFDAAADRPSPHAHRVGTGPPSVPEEAPADDDAATDPGAPESPGEGPDLAERP